MVLPLLLAGPILRRVEPRSVTVWLALRDAATVELSLWNSIANGGTGGGLFAGPDPDFESGPVQTLRVCDKLHIAVVTLEIAVPQLLPPGQTFSYNVTISTSQGTNDLKSLGLLRDNLFSAEGTPVSGSLAGHLHAAVPKRGCSGRRRGVRQSRSPDLRAVRIRAASAASRRHGSDARLQARLRNQS